MGVVINGGSDWHCRHHRRVAVVVTIDIDAGSCYNPSLVMGLQGSETYLLGRRWLWGTVEALERNRDLENDRIFSMPNLPEDARLRRQSPANLQCDPTRQLFPIPSIHSV